METALLFLVLLTCFSLIETLEGEPCVGIRREDSSYDFHLPDAVVENVQDVNCDAEWTIDQITAVLDGKSAHYSHPFKNVTPHGISVSYCPFLVKFHVSCPVSSLTIIHLLTIVLPLFILRIKYVRQLLCSCINSTSIHTVFSTTLPSGGDAIKTDSSVRQHCKYILKFHTNQKSNSSNNYPHFVVGRGYGTTDCKNCKTFSLSRFSKCCYNHHPEIPVLQATRKKQIQRLSSVS
ncbi:Conserved oligomeric Golgi complex subunit 3 [Labeo rohita]|uniref:Conserved oligomeric Golgi complex subunit 3 n=1 Tax=Labeo rohita TaxID=84645 RepID=A0ABQ8LXN0_LABRO|nr:Conserved oligomeric Golgi complex subunit 3 [Labeo rohita]